MFLKSPDGSAYAIIHETGKYPVRGGVFLIPPDIRARFAGFSEADEVPPEVAAELAGLGVLPLDAVVPAASSDMPATPEGIPVDEFNAGAEQADAELGDPDADETVEGDAEQADADTEPEQTQASARKPRSRKK